MRVAEAVLSSMAVSVNAALVAFLIIMELRSLLELERHALDSMDLCCMAGLGRRL